MNDENQINVEHQELLKDLKETVEGLLISQVTNVWNVYGGLNRLHCAMEKIFKHRLLQVCPNREINYMHFIEGLNWLQPNNKISSSVTTDSEYQSHIPVHLKNDRSSIWLYRNIETHSLSVKLSWLLSDKNHLLSCYEPSAFLCQDRFAEATLICLRAIERYQPSLLSDINPSLLLNQAGNNNFDRKHRRSSSFPNFGTNHEWSASKSLRSPCSVKDIDETIIESKFPLLTDEKISNMKKTTSDLNISIKDHKKETKKINSSLVTVGKIKLWNSLTNLKIETTRESHAISHYSIPNTPIHSVSPESKLSPSMLKIDYSKLHKSDFKTDDSIYIANENSMKKIMDENPSSDEKQMDNPDSISKCSNFGILTIPAASDITSFMPVLSLPGHKDRSKNPKKSFIEDGGSSIIPMATGYFPKPIQGQSLTSFLSSELFSRTNAELDRENAHFSVSEAMIAAIAQVKFNERMNVELNRSNCDNEISSLEKLRIKENLLKQKDFSLIYDPCNNDTRSSNASTITADKTNESIIFNTNIEDDFDTDIDNTSQLINSRSASIASLCSENDLTKHNRGPPDGQSDIVSAESVALSLISKFSHKQLPRASELEWLVSAKDAPQELLPMPSSWPVSPDVEDSFSVSPNRVALLRGTVDWAPPRPQIIFTCHPPPVRRTQIIKQNYRCAGCGMRVAVKYASRFRYCEYLGKFFCTGCHSNQLAVIPGRILTKWDFNRYPVSNFSYKLLDQMYSDPLFNVADINIKLYRKSSQLEKCRELRTKLFYVKDFILNCRFAVSECNKMKHEELYIYSEPEVYSLQDLLEVRKGEIQRRLSDSLAIFLNHISTCELCQARGFVCEICYNNEVIFPWNNAKVSRCSECGTCYHKNCWTSKSSVQCKRCFRMKLRKENREEIKINKSLLRT